MYYLTHAENFVISKAVTPKWLTDHWFLNWWSVIVNKRCSKNQWQLTACCRGHRVASEAGVTVIWKNSWLLKCIPVSCSVNVEYEQ